MIFQEAKHLEAPTHFWTGDGCSFKRFTHSVGHLHHAAGSRAWRWKSGQAPVPSNPPFLSCGSKTLQPVSTWVSVQPHGIALCLMGCVAMSGLWMTNKPCKCTHPLQMLLYATALNFTRGHSTTFWFTSWVLMKLRRSFGCFWSIPEILQSKITSGKSWWLKNKVKQDFSCIFCRVLVCLFTLPFFLLADLILSQLCSQVPFAEREEEQMFKDSLIKHMCIRIALICSKSLDVAN